MVPAYGSDCINDSTASWVAYTWFPVCFGRVRKGFLLSGAGSFLIPFGFVPPLFDVVVGLLSGVHVNLALARAILALGCPLVGAAVVLYGRGLVPL